VYLEMTTDLYVCMSVCVCVWLLSVVLMCGCSESR